MAKILQNKITNKIINSGFQVSQRGTSSSASGYLVDRFAWNALGGGGTAATFTQSQQVMPVGGDAAFKIQPSHFYRLTNTTIGTSLGLSSAHYIVHSIEDVSSVKSGINTLSFYARSSIANKQINVGLYQNFGSGGSTAVPVAGTAITLTASWRRYSIPFNLASIVGKTLGVNNNLTVLLYLQQGATDAANYGLAGIGFGGTGDTDITQMQFNEGGLLDYAPQGTSQAHELALCQRYYEKSFAIETAPTNGSNSTSFSTTSGIEMLSNSIWTGSASGLGVFTTFKVTKRTTPAMSRFGNNSSFWAYAALGTINIPTNSLTFDGAITLGQTSARGFVVVNNTSTSTLFGVLGHWTADAEF